ncbi:MAG: pseudouridine synthase [Gammaproteobacteria bacterium]|nr:pseudouridine synthase [Gammaproteobacteria bacterium]MDH3466491.1 pseudouridine synthase [Gammaproteobacteria bacterium]
MTEKVQKVLARSGAGSRREIERLIKAGRVSADGRSVRIGDRVDGTATLRIDGRQIRSQQRDRIRTRVIVYHKPEGEICTRSDPGGRPTVFARLPEPKGGRWVSVGRLDINTSGLLLLTNDGELADRLMHPRNRFEREYACRVRGRVESRHIDQMLKGVRIDGDRARFERIEMGHGHGVNRWYNVVLTQGRYREVRRIWEASGLQVSRLIRIRYGPIQLPRDLPPGRWFELQAPLLRQIQSVDGQEHDTGKR